MSDYAIIIGVEHYEDSRFSRLEGATNDANDFYEWVSDPSGGGILNDNSKKLLVSDDGLNKVFLKHIEDDICDLIESAKEDSEAKRLYFYFSGHGIGVTLDEVALIPTDWKHLLGYRAVAAKRYHDDIREYGIFDELIFILDCCRSRQANYKPQGSSLYSAITNPQAKTTESLVIFATHHWESAYENNLNYGNGTRENGFLTKALIEGLKGEAALRSGDITIGSLKGHLTTRVFEIAQSFNKKQKPKFINTFNDEKTIITKVTTSNDDLASFKTVISFTNATQGPYKIIDKDLNDIGTWNKDDGDWEIELKSGLNLLIDLTTGDELGIQVKKMTSEVINVEF